MVLKFPVKTDERTRANHERNLRDVASVLIRRIRTRTETGQGVNGEAFRPYSVAYDKQKSREVR